MSILYKCLMVCFLTILLGLGFCTASEYMLHYHKTILTKSVEVPVKISLGAAEQPITVHELQEIYYIEERGVGNKTYNVYLGSTIQQIDAYLPLLNIIDSADEKAVIHIHLAGDGGDADTLFMLANSLLNSKAKVIITLEGSVYSAHAILDFVADELRIPDYGLMMLHRISIYGKESECDDLGDKTDRTQSVKQKCIDSIIEYTKIGDEFFVRNIVPILGEQITLEILKGFDVYISFPDLIKEHGNVVKVQQIIKEYWETHDFQEVKDRLVGIVKKDRAERGI